MIDKIKQLLSDGCEMTLKSSKGSRNLRFADGAVFDPLLEVDSYEIERSFDRKITLRFSKDKKPSGYVQHSRLGQWKGKSNNNHLEMNPVVQHPWVKLNEYTPKTKTTNVYKEVLANGIDFDKYTEKFKFTKKYPAALVIFSYNRPQLLRELFSSLPADLELDVILIQDKYERDTHQSEIEGILEGSTFSSKQKFVRPIHFGLGRNVLDGMNQVFENYQTAVFFTDDIEVTDETPNYLLNMLEFAENQGNIYATQAWTTVNQPSKDALGKLKINFDRLLAFSMSAAKWNLIKEDVLTYMNRFLVTDYSTKPTRSMLSWLSGMFKRDFVTSENGVLPTQVDMRKRKDRLTRPDVDPFFVIEMVADSKGLLKVAPTWSRVTYKGKVGTNDRPANFLAEGYESIKKRANKRDSSIKKFHLEENNE